MWICFSSKEQIKTRAKGFSGIKVLKNLSSICKKQTNKKILTNKQNSKPKPNDMEKPTMATPTKNFWKSIRETFRCWICKQQEKTHHHPQCNKITQTVNEHKNTALLPNKTQIKSLNL